MAAFIRGVFKVFKSSLLWLGILYIYVTTFAFVLPWFCQNLGFSLYYNPATQTRERIEKMNEIRTTKAYKTLRMMPQNVESTRDFLTTDAQKYKDKGVNIAFIVVSVKRPANPHYLVQVVARLLEQTHRNKMQMNYKIIVFNADNNDSENEDIKLLSDYVTVVNTKDLNRNYSSFVHVYEKERLDYVSALQVGVHVNADYSVIIEDDALPDINFIRNLNFIIKWKIPWLRLSPKWAFLKLYYPEKWQGFGNTEVPEIILIFIVCGLLSTKLFLLVRRNRHSLVALFFIFLTSGSYFTSMAYIIGRAHLIELGKVSSIFYRVTEAPSCCTPAVLYPKEHIKDLVSFLQSKTCSTTYPLDFALDDFVTSQSLVKYLASPNLVSHIGFHSSLNKADKDIREFSLLFDP